jgi:phosphoglycerate dehydrogenase-like enzyme
MRSPDDGSAPATFPPANASTHAGKWEKNRFMGVEVTGKVFGLIGCGNHRLHRRQSAPRVEDARGSPMIRYLSPERATDLGVEKTELNELLARADFISLHTPLTSETRNLISAEAIARMKKGARAHQLRARAVLVDEAAVKAALDSAIWRALLSTCSRRSPRPAIRFSAMRKSSRHRISEPPPAKRKRTWHCRWPNRFRIIF